MKEMLILMAEYNIQTNAKLFNILESLSADDLNKDVGSFFGSILGIVNHMIGSTIQWLMVYPKFFPEVGDLIEKLPKMPEHSHGELVWDTLEKIKPVVSQVDRIFKVMVESIPESRLMERIHMERRSGKTLDKIGWQIILHLFNHQTHHRGSISTLLDQLKVENDYSNLLYIDF